MKKAVDLLYLFGMILQMNGKPTHEEMTDAFTKIVLDIANTNSYVIAGKIGIGNDEQKRMIIEVELIKVIRASSSRMDIQSNEYVRRFLGR